MPYSFSSEPNGCLIAPALLKKNQPSTIRWAGSKYTHMRDLSLLMPETIDCYVEPFLGGGNVVNYLLMKKRIEGRVILSDRSHLLVNYYHILQREPVRMAKSVLALHEQAGRGNKQLFNDALHVLQSLTSTPFEKAVALAVRNMLVRAEVSANLEGGLRGGFSQFRADNQGMTETQIRRLVAIGNLLQDVEIHCCDYRDTLDAIPSDNAFVFMDPPYFDPGEILYGVKMNFEVFTDRCIEISKDHSVMITIDGGEVMMELLSPFRQIVRSVYYPSTGKTVTEQVALNYEPKMMAEKLHLLEWTEARDHNEEGDP